MNLTTKANVDVVADTGLLEEIVLASKRNIKVIGANVDLSIVDDNSFIGKGGNVSAVLTSVLKNLDVASSKAIYDALNNAVVNESVVIDAAYGAVTLLPCFKDLCYLFEKEVDKSVTVDGCLKKVTISVQRYIEEIFIKVKGGIVEAGVDYKTSFLSELLVAENNTFHLSIPFGSRPPALQKHTLTLDIQKLNTYFYLFGGTDKSASLNNDLWVLDYNYYIWKKVSVVNSTLIPPKRHSHVAYVAKGLTVFGGIGENGNILCDSWVYSINDNLWTNTTTNLNRLCVARGSFTQNGEMIYIFGGGCNLKYFNADIYLLKLGNSTSPYVWKKVENTSGLSPGGLCGGSIVKLDNYRVLISGGINSSQFQTKTNVIWNSLKNKWIWADSNFLDIDLAYHSSVIFNQSLSPSTCVFIPQTEAVHICPHEKKLMLITYGGVSLNTLSDSLFIYRIGPESTEGSIKCKP
ncbi:Multiple epidermal growth factor-like domains protein 8, partial [Clydaea vesicula]